MPPSFSSFQWGRVLEHSFLEHFCQGRMNHEVHIVNWNTGIFEAESA